jgi:hypothetical protein
MLLGFWIPKNYSPIQTKASRTLRRALTAVGFIKGSEHIDRWSLQIILGMGSQFDNSIRHNTETGIDLTVLPKKADAMLSIIASRTLRRGLTSRFFIRALTSRYYQRKRTQSNIHGSWLLAKFAFQNMLINQKFACKNNIIIQ